MQQARNVQTLRDFLDAGYAVYAFCDACRHTLPVDLVALVPRLGGQFVVWGNLSRQLTCSHCGSHLISVMIAPPDASAA